MWLSTLRQRSSRPLHRSLSHNRKMEGSPRGPLKAASSPHDVEKDARSLPNPEAKKPERFAEDCEEDLARLIIYLTAASFTKREGRSGPQYLNRCAACVACLSKADRMPNLISLSLKPLA